MIKQIINQKLLEFFKEILSDNKIIYVSNNTYYSVEEDYYNSLIGYYENKRFTSYLYMDERYVASNKILYIFNLYFLLRMFIVYETEGL